MRASDIDLVMAMIMKLVGSGMSCQRKTGAGLTGRGAAGFTGAGACVGGAAGVAALNTGAV